LGFVHVPPLPEQLEMARNSRKGMDMRTLFKAARICVAVIASHISQLEPRQGVQIN